ncbi:MAG: preprotein translocase subunit SecG [Oscillospiraceae bacterium]
MSVLEIIGGVLLIITCVLAIILCLFQDSKQQQNMTAAITGGANDSFLRKMKEEQRKLF